MDGIFNSPFTHQLGIRPVEQDVELTATLEHTAASGFVHAGVLLTLLEMAAANMVRHMAVPHVISMTLFRPVRPDDKLCGTATILNEGKTTVCVQSSVFGHGKRVATGTFNFVRVEERSS